MTQEKRTPTSPGLFGLTGKDITLLSLLIVFLISGFGFAYLLVRCKQGNANFLCSAATPVVAATPTAVIPTVKPTAEVTAVQATNEPIPETATALPPMPTEEKPTSTPTNVPPTLTMTPTLPPPKPPTATPTAINSPTATATLTPTATATLTQTATDTLTSTLTVTTTTKPIVPAAPPSPQPATIIYVQGGGLPSSMGVVSSTGQLINDNLHGYAGAPAWSPDGKKIAFFGEPGIGQLGKAYGFGEGIWMIDYPSGGNPIQLFTTNHVKNLTWSPNGAWLAFEFGPEGSSHETYVVDATSGQKLFNFPGEQPAWSFDSQKLVIKTCDP
ncbi:MAG TPA: hypothetical protein VEC93_03535, partial [Anaerolineae bacterium]|nr:hypothetical protein [Anaerolineae bacterium]